ncbi:BTAD domain-containing putative transcriptional regulator [Streptomyces sp. NPDC053560]|uniref:BTAD domain-containing putative transcriptional regulator n=1 Tax=Streptomyces sp. NPDC053560 TaxID=3365711 RepID=UPI0037CE0738
MTTTGRRSASGAPGRACCSDGWRWRRATASRATRSTTACGAPALAAFEDIRGRLADELGADPSAGLREAHLAVLRGEERPPVPTAGPAPGRLPARLASSRSTACFSGSLGLSPGGRGSTSPMPSPNSRRRSRCTHSSSPRPPRR